MPVPVPDPECALCSFYVYLWRKAQEYSFDQTVNASEELGMFTQRLEFCRIQVLNYDQASNNLMETKDSRLKFG